MNRNESGSVPLLAVSARRQRLELGRRRGAPTRRLDGMRAVFPVQIARFFSRPVEDVDKGALAHESQGYLTNTKFEDAVLTTERKHPGAGSTTRPVRRG